jgi:phosphoribosylaminoimidazole (AIR) synthetase
LVHGQEVAQTDVFLMVRSSTIGVVQVVKGIVEGCKQSECILLGGEVRRLPIPNPSNVQGGAGHYMAE